MKILDEQQQLKKRIEELWDIEKKHSHEISLYDQKCQKYESRWFKNQGTFRVMKYMLEEMRRIEMALNDYRNSLQEQLTTLKNKE